MRIVIDMQGAQTQSRFRGIGRYSMALAQGIVRNCCEHDVVLVLNGFLPDSIETIRAAFKGILPRENIRVWYAPGLGWEEESDNSWRQEAAELIREAFLLSLKPDIIHLTSFFEGYVDNAVTGIGCLDSSVPVSVSLYDLIPLINADQYLKPNPDYEQYYLRKVDQLRNASVLLSISRFSRQEALDNLGDIDIPIVDISTAVDEHFRSIPITNENNEYIKQKFSIHHPFVLYTGGSDDRKNLPRLIRSYSQLAVDLRQKHQLVFAGKVPDGHRLQLQNEMKKAGLKESECCFTGYVSDEELVQLYNLCKVFVFPSWHEGFGLPALEAMSCGAVTIGASATSVPEVIGLEAALFDPYSEGSMTEKLSQALCDSVFRSQLIQHARQQVQKFSWDITAQKAIAAFEKIVQHRQSASSLPVAQPLPRLAFISPLPPERCGIADYSADLLPALAKHYTIEVITSQKSFSDSHIRATFPVRTVAWFEQHIENYDRILYQFGNSPFHEHMFELLLRCPGVVVLHDFFLSGVKSYQEIHGGFVHAWERSLYNSHGYQAVKARHDSENEEDIIVKYPCNLEVLQNAAGVVVHSHYSKQLAQQWYGENIAADWSVIPLLRAAPRDVTCQAARLALGLQDDDFIVCSFGMLAPSKLNHRLLHTWINSTLAENPHCKLIFVGENHGGSYGRRLLGEIETSHLEKQVQITGWVDAQMFHHYLAAADMAVQLRSQSRGETSATVFDCMNYALPTIVNASGSMAELPDDAVWMLDEEFEDSHLTEALETLWHDGSLRSDLGGSSQEHLLAHHSPLVCAEKYAGVIEQFHVSAQENCHDLVAAIAAKQKTPLGNDECMALAQSIAWSFPRKGHKHQLLIDVTATHRSDLKTGIERVVRSIISELLEVAPEHYRVEPVYLTNEGGNWHYRYARQYTLGLLGCPTDTLADDVVLPHSGDFLLGVDLSGQVLIDAEQSGLLTEYRELGVTVSFIVYDLLPIQLPQFFSPDADVTHASWLEAVSRQDGAICISRTVAKEFQLWLKTNSKPRSRSFKTRWFHLGADIENSVPSSGLPVNSGKLLMSWSQTPSFLMVGTIEPRKGYLQTIEAFTRLWSQGHDIHLIIVGKEGWRDLPDSMRCTIPDIVDQLHHHPELNNHLFWLDGISDEYLEKVYTAASCLLAASEGEGFGLPLIEAAQHQLPIIARDIPAFREVAGEHAFYFSNSESPLTLAGEIQYWLELYHHKAHPTTDEMVWQSWKESAQQLLKIIRDQAR